MHDHWLVLLPPVVVLVLGFTTRRVAESLLVGIGCAAMIATDFAPLDALKQAGFYLFENTELAKLTSFAAFSTSWNLFICLFLFMLGILVVLIAHTGGAHAYVNLVGTKIKSARSAEASSLVLSSMLFVDDYFNSLTVGSVMQPLTDRFKIPRAKLAFLVDSMASPLAMLIPLSSWVAAIVGFLREAGVDTVKGPGVLILDNPFSVYFRTLPYLFYSYIAVIGAWYIVLRRISFGPMHTHEHIAQTTGNLFGGKTKKATGVRTAHKRNRDRSSLSDFLFPIGALFASIIGGLLYTGGHTLFGGTHSIAEALQHANAASALFWGGIVTLTASFLFFAGRKKVAGKEIGGLVVDGVRLMAPSIIVLLLAWTLGDILKKDLFAGEYLAKHLVGTIDVQFLPLMFFIASAIISFSIGSSWGTMAILFPMAIPMALSFAHLIPPVAAAEVNTLFPMLGAILSGAVMGDHISPISDTTVMSSTSTGCHHIDHVETQLIYSIPMLASTAIAFILAGVLQFSPVAWSIFLPLGVGILLTCGSLQLLDFLSRRRRSATGLSIKK